MAHVAPHEGYIGFLDVLGFSDLIARDDSLNEIARYVESIQTAVAKTPSTSLGLALFSDSIVLSEPSADPEALLNVIEVSSRIFGALLKLRVPVRGAITFGKFIRSGDSSTGTIVAGRPLVEALQWEHQQDWVGITLAPSVTRRHHEELIKLCTKDGQDFTDRFRWAIHLHQHNQIPFQSNGSSGSAYVGFAVVPFTGAMGSQEFAAKLDEMTSDLWSMRFLAPDPTSQQKCQAAIDFLHKVGVAWSGKSIQFPPSFWSA
jgi:hypothetical protein